MNCTALQNMKKQHKNNKNSKKEIYVSGWTVAEVTEIKAGEELHKRSRGLISVVREKRCTPVCVF